MVHRAPRIKALSLVCAARGSLRVRELPDVPADFERFEVLLERLDPPHVDVRGGRRRVLDAHPRERRLLVVRDEAEADEPLCEVARRRAPADPPLAARDLAARALLARPRDCCFDVVEPQALQRGAVPSGLEEELVMVDRLEAGSRQHVRGGVLGELCDRRFHGASLPVELSKEGNRDRRPRRTRSRQADQPLDLRRAVRRHVGPQRPRVQPGDGPAVGRGGLRDGRGGRPRRPGGEGGVPGVACALDREARGDPVCDPRARARAARGDREVPRRPSTARCCRTRSARSRAGSR